MARIHDIFGAVDGDLYIMEPSGSLPPNINLSSVFATFPTPITATAAKKRPKKKPLKDKKVEMLQLQTKHSVHMIKCLRNFFKYMYRVSKYAEKIELLKENVRV